MALATYSDLKASVADFLNRTDLTSQIADFIALAEADINSHFDLRTVESDVTLTATSGSRFIALPAGFREAQNLWINWSYGRGEPLRFVVPELLQVSTVQGIPLAWCIDGTNIAFERPFNEAYTLTLRMTSGVALSDANPTNLILTNYPNVYLYGALKEAAPYLRDADLMAMYDAKYSEAIQKAKAKEGRIKAPVTASTEPGLLTRAGRRTAFNINRGY